MSLKKLAKAINNLAVAVTYHADMQSGRAYADMIDNQSSISISDVGGLAEDCDGFATSADIESKVYAAEGFSVNDPEFIKGFDAGVVPVFQTEAAPVADYEDPYDASPLSEDRGVFVDLDTEAAEIEALQARHVAPAGVELDSRGLPWDSRIHSSGKSFLSDGSWRMRRGLEADKVAEIESELRALMALPVPAEQTAPPAPTPANVFAATPATADQWVDHVKAQKLSTAMPPAPTPAPPTPQAPAPDLSTATADTGAEITAMPQFLKAATAAGVPKGEMDSALRSVGLESVTQIAARPDLIPALVKVLEL